MPSKCCAPNFEMLPTSLSVGYLFTPPPDSKCFSLHPSLFLAGSATVSTYGFTELLLGSIKAVARNLKLS